MFPLTVAFCIPAPLFHHFSFSKPSVWMSLYAGIHRLVIAAFVNVTFLVLMFADRDSFFGRLRSSRLLENAFYRVLGRLGFGFYLIHMTVLKTVYGNHHEALRGSTGLVVRTFAHFPTTFFAEYSISSPVDYSILFSYNDNIRSCGIYVHSCGKTF